ncbi:MAG: hypothetical protein R2688_01210 [Fimbriimonadaceae bacterium]
MSIANDQSIQFKLLVKGTAADPKQLKAEFGEIGLDGSYATPAEYPPMGLDTITTYNESGNPVAQVHIQIEPGGGFASIQSSPKQDSDDEFYEQTTQAEEIGRPLHEEKCPMTSVNGVRGYEVPLVVAQRHSDPKSGSDAAEMVDDHSLLLESTQLLVVSDEPVRMAFKRGVLPSLEGQSGNGKKVVSSNWKVHLEKDVSSAGFSLSSYPVKVSGNYFRMKAVRIRFEDHYKSVNGKWVFDTTKEIRDYGWKAWSFDPEVIPSASTLSLKRVSEELGFDRRGYKFDGKPMEMRM